MQNTAKRERATYTIGETAEILGIARGTAYELAKAGTLPGVRKLARRYVVSRRELEAYLSGAVAATVGS